MHHGKHPVLIVLGLLAILPAAALAQQQAEPWIEQAPSRPMQRQLAPPDAGPMPRQVAPPEAGPIPHVDTPFGPVQPVVIQFRHIPADSFIDTVESLAEQLDLPDDIRRPPMAINEDANAIVFIAPPQLAQALQQMARQLDQPNPFQQRRQPMQMHPHMMDGRDGGMMHEGMDPGDGERMQCPRCGMILMRVRTERQEDAPVPRPGGAEACLQVIRGAMGLRRLNLDEDQSRQVREVFSQTQSRLAEVRRELAEELRQRSAEACREALGELHETLEPQQRQRLAQRYRGIWEGIEEKDEEDDD